MGAGRMARVMHDPTHELHRRRFGRNLGVGLSLGVIVAIVFALTLVKIAREGPAGPGAAVPDPATAGSTS